MVHTGINIAITLIVGIIIGVMFVCLWGSNTTVQSAEKFSDYTIQGITPSPKPTSVAALSNPRPDAASSGVGNYNPSNQAGNTFADVSSSVAAGSPDTISPTCYPRDRLTAEDLLPKDAANSKWAQLNPSGQGDVQDQNFLTAGYHVGVNTQGQSLRNANYQLRSEPANPQQAVSPWNIATIEPDVNRRALEIGGDF